MLFSGIANARESHDDHTKCFRIIVDVRNLIWAGLLGITAALMSNGSRSSVVISQSTFSRRGRKDASNARRSHVRPRIEDSCAYPPNDASAVGCSDLYKQQRRLIGRRCCLQKALWVIVPGACRL